MLDIKLLKEEREILNSKAFRRLKGKTQVKPTVGQHIHATERLTHSLEVGVNARIILAHIQNKFDNKLPISPIRLNNISMLHDIGHPPMGHLFEKITNNLFKKQNIYFEGNANNLKIIEKEKLNISLKTIVALIKYPVEINDYQHKGLYNSQFKKYMPILIEEIKKQYIEMNMKNIHSIQGDNFLKLLNEINLKEFTNEEDLLKYYKQIIKNTNMRLLETIIMEEADDITYLTHDLKDYMLYVSKSFDIIVIF